MGARVIALFGAPGCGKSTIARILQAASNKMVAIARMDDDLDSAYLHAEVVIVDSIHTAAEVKLLWEHHFVDGAHGAIVHVLNAGMPTTPEWDERRIAIEAMIELYSLNYRTIMNEPGDIEAPVGELARVAQLRS